MKLVEFYPELQGRPESKVALDMDKRGPSIPSGFISGTMLQSSYSVTNITNNYAPTNRTIILCDVGSAPVTISLPTASANSGRYYIIKKVDSTSNKVIIEPELGELIDGEVSIELGLQYQYVMICCSGVPTGGSEWHIIGGADMKMEEIVKSIGEEQNNLLAQLLIEIRQNKMHLASLSDAVIEPGDGDD